MVLWQCNNYYFTFNYRNHFIIIKGDKKKAEQYFNKAKRANDKGDYNTAKSNYEKVIELNPNYVNAYNNLALLLTKHFQEYKKAKQYFEKAIELDPSYVDAYYNFITFLSHYSPENEIVKQYFAKYTELTKTDEKDFTKKYAKKIKSINSVIIKNYADKELVGKASEALSQNKELILKAKDNNKNEFDFLDLNFAENIFAYGINRSRREGEEDKYNFMTLFSNKIKLTDPVAWLQKLDYYESRKDYESPFPLKSAIEIFKDILDDNVEIEISPDAVVFTERGTPLEFHQLSDGYKCVLIWVSDLIVKLSRNQVNAKSTKDFEGVVLIDEIDLHLHPKWSYSIVSKLRRWFPKIQWIFTTHSPIITLAASPDAVFYKLYKENGEIKVNQPIEKLNMTANSLLTSLLWRLDSFTTKDIDQNQISSDDYVYQKIHQVISKRIKDVPNLVDDDIMKMIEKELDNIDK